MNVRRVLVWVVSTIFGVAMAAAVILLFGTTLQKFSVVNAFLVFLSFGALAFIWLDLVFRTQYLRS